jgi:hypothetical protein
VFLPYFAGVLRILKDLCEMSCGRLNGCYAGHVMKLSTCTKNEILAKAHSYGVFRKFGQIKYYFDENNKEIGYEVLQFPNQIFVQADRVWDKGTFDDLFITKLK